MFKTTLAAGMVAGGLMAFSPVAAAAVVSPAGLESAAAREGNVVEVRKRGGRRGFRGRSFRGHKAYRGRSYSRRHFGRGWNRGYRKHRRYGRRYGGRRFIYGALPFVGYYSYGYRSSCGWLWRKYRYTGSRYWYRRWRACRYY